jgi:hypothetical protein
LRRFDTLIDYDAAELLLLEPDSRVAPTPVEGWRAYQYRGNLMLDIRFPFIDGQHEMLLDSGCGCTLVSRRSGLGRKLQSALSEQTAEIIYDGITGGEYRSYEIDNLYLEDYDLGETRLAIGDIAPYIRNGLLGFDFFANNTVYINFRRQQIWLRPVEVDSCSAEARPEDSGLATPLPSP